MEGLFFEILLATFLFGLLAVVFLLIFPDLYDFLFGGFPLLSVGVLPLSAHKTPFFFVGHSLDLSL